ncbi:MAG: hypothetical protein Ct9H300mP12_11490 [Acidimicrobiales bacterium]|nr:MAG: hypothetical protein Ct9H300mP12_11490 [Acidimicrobiales bacterium]
MASTTRPLVLGAAHPVFGGSSLAVMLSRQADLTRRIPVALRGRAMSLMGGTMRFSVLLGTATGGVLVDLAGARWTFLAAGIGAAIGIPAVCPALALLVGKWPPSVPLDPASSRYFGPIVSASCMPDCSV